MLLAPELIQLQALAEQAAHPLHHQVLTELTFNHHTFPLHHFWFGSSKPDAPVIFYIGGVHGVERIGAQVVIGFLETLKQRLRWDSSFIQLLKQIRIHCLPIINPVGLNLGLRSNGNGVDLMRNAPVNAKSKTLFLIGGQRISRRIPWYRGNALTMEAESLAVNQLVLQEAQTAPLTLILDVHSGYGFRDRLWFPLAASQEAIEHLPEYVAQKELLTHTYPHLDYIFEPQSRRYCTHGDLWDHVYLEALSRNQLVMPLTLEMGSWRWVKKNPFQAMNRSGFFNPVKPHRIRREMRRHLVLMDCLLRATQSYDQWLPLPSQREQMRQRGLQEWFSHERR